MSSYRTIEGAAQAEVVEKRSRFIAHLAHVGDEEAALRFLQEVRTEHAQARHNVYAYVLRGGRVRYSDDGEPPQTSGMPTYEALAHAGFVDVICVTTRYFGGTLLGTGGLVRAYTQACQKAVAAARGRGVGMPRRVARRALRFVPGGPAGGGRPRRDGRFHRFRRVRAPRVPRA